MHSTQVIEAVDITEHARHFERIVEKLQSTESKFDDTVLEALEHAKETELCVHEVNLETKGYENRSKFCDEQMEELRAKIQEMKEWLKDNEHSVAN